MQLLVVQQVHQKKLFVTVLQASVAVAEPSAALISEAVGVTSQGNVVPGAVITGAILSVVQVTVVEAVAELPQPSTAVNVLVWRNSAAISKSRCIRRSNSYRTACISSSSRTKCCIDLRSNGLQSRLL